MAISLAHCSSHVVFSLWSSSSPVVPHPLRSSPTLRGRFAHTKFGLRSQLLMSALSSGSCSLVPSCALLLRLCAVGFIPGPRRLICLIASLLPMPTYKSSPSPSCPLHDGLFSKAAHSSDCFFDTSQTQVPSLTLNLWLVLLGISSCPGSFWPGVSASPPLFRLVLSSLLL